MTNSPERTSPLAEVKPESLNILFNTPPDELTDEQVDKIVAALQTDRERFLLTETAPKSTAKKAPKVAADPGLSIDDLDL